MPQGLDGRGGRLRGGEVEDAGCRGGGVVAGHEGMVELEEEDADVAVSEGCEEAGDVGALVDALDGGGEGVR